MILDFKNTFRKDILNGDKIHTVRTDISNRWNKGSIINFYSDFGNPKQCHFKDDVVKDIQHLKIEFYGNRFINPSHIKYSIEIDGNKLDGFNMVLFCVNDGFHSTYDFLSFFLEKADQINDNLKVYEGKVLHWTDYKY